MLSGVNLSKIPLRENLPGLLGILEFSELDFVPKRLYWLSNIPHGSSRGRHAHKTLQQVFILIQGSVTIEISKGPISHDYRMTTKGEILTIPPKLWREIRESSADAIILVVCDQPYNESDYIRDYEEYIRWYKCDAK